MNPALQAYLAAVELATWLQSLLPSLSNQYRISLSVPGGQVLGSVPLSTGSPTVSPRVPQLRRHTLGRGPKASKPQSIARGSTRTRFAPTPAMRCPPRTPLTPYYDLLAPPCHTGARGTHLAMAPAMRCPPRSTCSSSCRMLKSSASPLLSDRASFTFRGGGRRQPFKHISNSDTVCRCQGSTGAAC